MPKAPKAIGKLSNLRAHGRLGFLVNNPKPVTIQQKKEVLPIKKARTDI